MLANYERTPIDTPAETAGSNILNTVKYFRFPASASVSSSSDVLSALNSVAFAMLLFAVLRGPFILWSQNGIGVVPAGSIFLLLGSAILVFSMLRYGQRFREIIKSPLVGIFGLLLVLFSDWLTFRFNLFQGPSIRGELLLGFAAAALILLNGLTAILPYVAAGFSLFLVVVFLDEASGKFLFSDDHTAVFYRLTLLLENFPHIPFYNPLWNAGLDARDFFATGILNFYFLFYPLLKLFGADDSYTYLVGAVIFILVPLVAALAAKVHGLPRPGILLSAGLALSSSLLWYRWCLKYGAMGFVISTALVPLNLAFATVVLRGAELRWWQWTAFFITLTLMGFWVLSFFIFLPLVCYVLLRRRDVFVRPAVSIFLAVFLLFNLPWIAIFLDSSKVFEFVRIKAPSMEEQYADAEAREAAEVAQVPQATHTSAAVKGTAKPLTAKGATKAIRNFATNSNPLLLFFALPGLFALPFSESRKAFALCGAWLLFLGVFCAPAVPQLELERMLVVLALIFVVPVAAVLIHLLQEADNGGLWAKLAIALPFAFVLVSGPIVSGIIRNRSLEHYAFADETVWDISRAIKQNRGGRVLFSGFVLHELSQGHLAPLAYWTNEPLIASSPFHNRWKYTNVVPEFFMSQGWEGAEKFFDLMNATSVIAHEREWKNYFASHPEQYKLVWSGGRFQLFSREPTVGPPSYFLEGSGEIVEQNSHQVILKVFSQEAVIKFNYFPFLKASGCEVEPFSAGGDLTLIRLRNCKPKSLITLEAVNAFQRLRS